MELYFYYMQRSGSHAIVNWLANCIHLTTNETVRLHNVGTKHDYGKGNFKHFLKVHENIPPPSKTKKTTIVIIRDVFNWAASIRQCDLQKFKKIETPRENFPLGITITEKVGTTHNPIQTAQKYIEIAHSQSKKIIILFNKWFLEEDYRQNICSQLNIDYFEDGLDCVPYFGGGGSSFDGTTMDGNGRKMLVIERWRNFVDDDIYMNFLRGNPRLIEVSNSLFNFCPISL